MGIENWRLVCEFCGEYMADCDNDSRCMEQREMKGRIDKLEAERDQRTREVELTYLVQKKLTDQRDALVEALRNVLDTREQSYTSWKQAREIAHDLLPEEALPHIEADVPMPPVKPAKGEDGGDDEWDEPHPVDAIAEYLGESPKWIERLADGLQEALEELSVEDCRCRPEGGLCADHRMTERLEDLAEDARGFIGGTTN